MNTKLTLRLDDRLIQQAKRYADRSGVSVSQLVADYFALLAGDETLPGPELTPRVRALVGALQAADVTREDYQRHLVEKYR